MPLTAWVYMGGGLNGRASAAQATRVWALGSRPSIYAGESIGAYLAYMTALTSPAEVDTMWDNLTASDFYRGGGKLAQYLTLLGLRPGIYDCTPGLETLRRFVAGRRLPRGVVVIVLRADLKWGVLRQEVLTSDTPPDACCEMVYQSGLVPIAHGCRDHRWADGGVCACAPLGPAVKAGADHCEVFALDLPGVSRWEGAKPLDEAWRAVDVLRDHLTRADLRMTVERNRHPRPGDRQISARYWVPVDPLPDWMDASPAAMEARARMRYKGQTLDEYHLAAEAWELDALGRSVAGL